MLQIFILTPSLFASKLSVAYFILVLLLSLGSGFDAQATELSEFDWQKRPLLLFAPANQDRRLLQTLQLLQNKNCDVQDRDMVIGIFVAQGRNMLAEKPVEWNDAFELRKRFRIANDRFIALLIGKDGGEKYRTDEIPDLQQIFTLIDGMPMRKDEMQDRPNDCNS